MARVKGQSSSEYLSLLAAVLVVGLAAVTLLQYFPGMGGEASATESHLYWASSIRPIGVLEATVLNGSICDAYGSLHSGYRMAIINSDPDPLYVTNLSIDGTVEEFCALNANSSETSLSLGPGQTAIIDMQGQPCQPGKLAELELVFTYDTPYSQGKEEVGAKKLAFRCAQAVIVAQMQPCLSGNCTACTSQAGCAAAGCTWNATNCI